jgi:hypothetical protein
LNPDTWFASDASPPSTDRLPPFHHKFTSGEVDYFTSDDVRDWVNFGYQYDMLEQKLGESKDDYITRIKVYIATTYQNTGHVLLKDRDNLFKDVNIQDHTYDDYVIDYSTTGKTIPAHIISILR